MNVPFNPPSPILDLSDSELRNAVKDRTEKNLLCLLDKLSSTVFYKESSALAALRDARANGDGELQHFFSTVPFTSYDDYSPFVSRFFARPCGKSAVDNLLAPGLPLFLAHTSGTSGSAPKYFPKYPSPQFTRSPWNSPDAPKISMCGFNSLRISRLVEIVDEDKQLVADLPVTIISSGGLRYYLGIEPRDDDKILDQKARFSPIPFAVWFLPSYQSNIFMNSFFALTDPSIIFMNATLSTILYDAIRIIEENWDMMVKAIEQGILPEVDGLGGYRKHLEPFVEPNPTRATELSQIEVGSPGWLKKVWPSLVVIRVTLSGQYSSLEPKLRYHFGPTVSLQSVIFSATECMVGFGYDANNTNLYRLDSNEHIEFLDVQQERSPDNLLQPWETKCGNKYEIFVTTHDGLWRYALNDIVEVAGYSPIDGQPLIKYCERKGVGFRVAGEFVSESELQEVVASLSQTLGQVLEFTTEIDNRRSGVLGSYGFFVELASDTGPSPNSPVKTVQDALLKNPGYKKYFEGGFIGTPTIRVVAPGTFKAYRDWRIQRTGFTVGQVKVPITIVDPETKDWLLGKVTSELQSDFAA